MAIIQNLEAFVQSYPAGLDSVTDLQLSQNENGRQIRFTIGGVTIPAGSVATISGTKPDGVVYSNTGTIEGADTVIFNEDVQMTAVFGTWYAKIRITNAGNTIASARVRFIIDKDPVDAGAIPSESQLDGLVAEAEEYAEAAGDAAERAAITYGSPLTASTAAAMTDVNRVYVYTGSESGYTYGNWYYYNGSAWVSGGVYNSAAVETDTTLTESGVPADAKATGDKIAELKDDLTQTNERIDSIEPGLSNEAKAALLACFRHVSFLDDDDDYYGELETALNYEPPHTYSLDAVFTPGDYVVYAGDTLDTLAPYLTVTYYEDSVGTVVSSDDYALSGTLSIGNNTITVSYNGLTATITVTAIDFYNVFRWEYNTGGTGNVKKYNIGTYDKVITVSGREIAVGILTGNANPSTGSGGTRRTYTTDRGKYPVVVGSTLNPTILYPIPIPPTATKYTATVSVGEICVYIYKYHEDLIDNKYHYERINEAIYGVGSRSENFTAQDNLFLCMMCRMNSSNQTYTTEPVFTLVFE